MEEPTSYLDLLEGQAGVRERIEYLTKANIVAEMDVSTYASGSDVANIVIHNKSLLTNRINHVYFDLYNVHEVKYLLDKIQNEEEVYGYILSPEEEGVEEKVKTQVSMDEPDIVELQGPSGLVFSIDEILFVRLLEEFVDMVENREKGEVIITIQGDVIKKIK